MADGERPAKNAWVERVLGVAMTAKPRGAVSYAKLLLEWRGAQQRASASLSTFGASFLALDEVQDDPRFPHVARAVKELPGLIPTFGEELADHLGAAMNTGVTEAGSTHLRAALKTLSSYRQQLSGVPALVALAALAKRAVGIDLVAHAALESALAVMEQEISARLAATQA